MFSRKELMKYRQIRYLTIGAGILLAIMLMLALFTSHRLDHTDEAFSQWVFTWRQPVLDTFFATVTDLAGAFGIIVLSTIIVLTLAFYFHQRTLAFWYALMMLVSNLLVNPLLKNVFQRERPALSVRLVEAGSYSFPSGHSLGAVTAFGGLMLILAYLYRNKNWRTPTNIGLLLLIGLIGFSRIYLGVHYLSDVLAGFALGAFCLGLSVEILNRHVSNDS